MFCFPTFSGDFTLLTMTELVCLKRKYENDDDCEMKVQRTKEPIAFFDLLASDTKKIIFLYCLQNPEFKNKYLVSWVSKEWKKYFDELSKQIFLERFSGPIGGKLLFFVYSCYLVIVEGLHSFHVHIYVEREPDFTYRTQEEWNGHYKYCVYGSEDLPYNREIRAIANSVHDQINFKIETRRGLDLETKFRNVADVFERLLKKDKMWFLNPEQRFFFEYTVSGKRQTLERSEYFELLRKHPKMSEIEAFIDNEDTKLEIYEEIKLYGPKHHLWYNNVFK